MTEGPLTGMAYALLFAGVLAAKVAAHPFLSLVFLLAGLAGSMYLQHLATIHGIHIREKERQLQEKEWQLREMEKRAGGQEREQAGDSAAQNDPSRKRLPKLTGEQFAAHHLKRQKHNKEQP